MISTDSEFIFFMSSSGHCSLDCSYCIINPIAKHEPSLNISDIEYILDTVGGKSALLFSGKGDFFAGYRKGENLLSKILERDVDVALDINGVIIQELPTISNSKLDKIKHINLTMHYTQLINKNSLAAWEKNSLFIIQRKQWERLLVNFIVSPQEAAYWGEALSYYNDHIFKKTGKKIVLIRDTLNWSASFEDQLQALIQKFDYLVEEERYVDFAKAFEGISDVLCPAGKEYFRVWNDGRIEGCPYISELADCGNAKMRTFRPRETLFHCNQPRYCDCGHIEKFGKMRKY